MHNVDPTLPRYGTDLVQEWLLGKAKSVFEFGKIF